MVLRSVTGCGGLPRRALWGHGENPTGGCRSRLCALTRRSSRQVPPQDVWGYGRSRGGVGCRASPPEAVGGVFSRRVLRAGARHVHGEGRNGDAARTGHARRTPWDRKHALPPPGGEEPTRRKPTSRTTVGTCTGACMASASWMRGRPEEGRGQWGGWRDGAEGGGAPASPCRGPGRAPADEAVPGGGDASPIQSQEHGHERPLGTPVLDDTLLQAACARLLKALDAQEVLGGRDG